jgi:hypothetical protein
MSTRRIAAAGFLVGLLSLLAVAAAGGRGKAITIAIITATITNVHGMIARIGTNTVADRAISDTGHTSAFFSGDKSCTSRDSLSCDIFRPLRIMECGSQWRA